MLQYVLNILKKQTSYALLINKEIHVLYLEKNNQITFPILDFPNLSVDISIDTGHVTPLG